MDGQRQDLSIYFRLFQLLQTTPFTATASYADNVNFVSTQAVEADNQYNFKDMEQAYQQA